MTKPLTETERWEDPIVAEVRAAREKLFAAAGYDLKEFCKRLNDQQEREGRRTTNRAPRTTGGKLRNGRTRRSRRRPKAGRA
jgi:hypothetical protein